MANMSGCIQAAAGSAWRAALLAVGVICSGTATAGQISLAAVDDTLVNASKTDVYYGLTHYLSVRFSSTVINHSYLKFDLTGIPDDVVLTSARLLLYPYSISDQAPLVAVHHVADDAWQEATLRWLDRPAFDVMLANGVPELDTWQSFDLLAGGAWAYETDLADGFLSLLLKEGEPLTLPEKRVWYSPAEHQSSYPYEPPSLEITWRTVPEPAGAGILALSLVALAMMRRARPRA